MYMTDGYDIVINFYIFADRNAIKKVLCEIEKRGRKATASHFKKAIKHKKILNDQSMKISYVKYFTKDLVYLEWYK